MEREDNPTESTFYIALSGESETTNMNHHMCLKTIPRPVPTEQPLPTSPADGWQAGKLQVHF